MGIAEQISIIRDLRIPPERIKKRAEFENKARDLLATGMATITMKSVDSIISLVDSDFWQGTEVEGRFAPLFSSPNRNKMMKNHLTDLKKFLVTAFVNEDAESVDDAIKNLDGIYYGAASLFFYIKNSDRYNVFLRTTVKGLRAVYPRELKSLAYDRPFEKNYSLFNKFCKRFKEEYSVRPQELDIILTNLGRQEEVEVEEEKKQVLEVKTKPLIISSHLEAEAVLLEIGNLLGYETYTADPSKTYEGNRLGEIASSKDVPEALGNIRNVEKTDVIWYKEDMPPTYFFEVEHGGTMRDALHRLYQARHLNARFFVIGPKENLPKFEDWVSTAPYKSSRKLYNFKTFDELSKLYSLIKNAEDFKKVFGIA